MMKRQMIGVVAAALFVTVCPTALACIWDYDTLAMERQRFPDALELIAGKFLRHSAAFYEWRVQDREQRLADEPSDPALYDDLAVAYEKLGDHAKAIELMLRKLERFPGLYETHANLGTFYIHAGEFDRGVDEIERAIEINTDAHFGREIYQKHLVRCVQSKQTDGVTKLPLDVSTRIDQQPVGFATYALNAAGIVNSWEKGEARDAEVAKATKGVLGMMRFGNYDSPILLEALGDLLLSRGYPDDAKRLAARAYLKASYEVDDDSTRAAYREMAKQCLSMQTVHNRTDKELTLDRLEQAFAKELEDAAVWYEAVEADEHGWIAAGVNPEVAFASKYYAEPEVTSVFIVPVSRVDIALGIATAAILGIVVLAVRRVLGRARA